LVAPFMPVSGGGLDVMSTLTTGAAVNAGGAVGAAAAGAADAEADAAAAFVALGFAVWAAATNE